MSKKTVKIGDFCRKLMLEGKAPEEVIKRAKKKVVNGEHIGKNVNAKHIAWYAWDMRKESSNHYQEDLPTIYQK